MHSPKRSCCNYYGASPLCAAERPRPYVGKSKMRLVSLPQSVTTSGDCHRRVTIGQLSEEVLLNIFCYYLDASPRFFFRLVHVCRKWRRIVFASRSQRVLHLQLSCTPGTPVSKTLDCWPTLPIFVKYGGSPTLDPPTPEDEDNIVAALKQSDRVNSIYLTLTRSLLEKVPSIDAPFPELQELVLLSLDNVQLTLPSAFRWGPYLRTLHLTRIAIPALPQLLSSSRGLVNICLHEIPGIGYFSPQSFRDALSGMTQLQSLSIHFLSAADYIAVYPLSGKRVVLPTLTCLKYRGTSEYLDSLVARIDAPRLGDIEITFFDEFMFGVSNLSEFINRVEMQKSHRQAYILFTERSVSISLTQPAPTRFKLQVFCDPLNRQLFSMAQICRRFSAFLFCVEDLRIEVMRLSSSQEGAKRWLELIRSFKGTKWFHVAGDSDFSTDVVLALHRSGRRRGIVPPKVLPALHKLCIREPEPHCVPLRTAVGSFIVSRRLWGYFTGVEYERPWINGSCASETAPCSQQVTIRMLSEDVLLNIFRHYMVASPQFWPTLAHVCRVWRQIVFASTQGLDLRLYCTYGTPVLKTLYFWPTLPIVVQYGGSPTLGSPAPEDEDNVMAALKHSDRVSSIGLTVTTSLLTKLFAIEKPFSKLEELALLSPDNVQMTLPSTLRWGTCLRRLQSTRIAIPALPQLLSSSENLVDLRLHEIPSIGYLSPKAFANALSAMTQLQSLSLHFLSPTSRPSGVGISPLPSERIVLPSLSQLKFRGTSEYLNCLVTRIDAPRLGDIQVRFYNQLIFHVSQLGQFIDRIEMQKSHRRVDIVSSDLSISVCFTQPGEHTRRLGLQISCEQLDWQLSSITQICHQLSPFLFHVENLGIYTIRRSTEQDYMDGEQWVELIRTYGDSKDFRVAGELATDILRALCPADGGDMTMLPSLRTLGVPGLGQMRGPLWEAVESLVTPHRHNGRPVQVYKVMIPAPHWDSMHWENPPALARNNVSIN